ncbi:DUF11 domain-containing protein [Qipengyuania aurantiaca]|uniref:DUF11 domain-containing protein n=1 Tax=Qipengyuania aurantiaca TaxID=2867233 RepID=A0ABX8ZLD0_9SPHN|nr:DUF11 domain-containing protein [Qipengyuania aurantiaca]QZD88939.1 DUF11 domain-containing protein [Qipengyuania aurantiaca]
MLLPIAVFGGAARAQSIDNTANASWVFGGTTYETESNLVSIDIATSDVAITVYRPISGTGETLDYRSSRCSSAGFSTSAGTNEVQTANVQRTTEISAGNQFFFEISAPLANLNPSAVDILHATLVSSTGDREQITVYETGENTGVFVGSIATHRVPPNFIAEDCRLGVIDQGIIQIGVSPVGSTTYIVTAEVDVDAPSFNTVFDSETGEAVTGARVTLVDVATGQPALVYSEDGITVWPATVVTGQPITTAAGDVVPMGPGQFWFPVVPEGTYRLLVEPPSPYTAPSQASPALLASLTGSNGEPFVIVDASFGGTTDVAVPGSLRLDIPLDRPGLAVGVTKTASRQIAQPGDVVLYTISITNQDTSRPRRDVTVTDVPSRWLRLRRDSIRIDGEAAGTRVAISDDASRIDFDIGTLNPGQTVRITYAMTVSADAPPGEAENRVIVNDLLGRETVGGNAIRIERETIAGRMTIIGRVTAGECSLTEGRAGIAGVRVMLEDGSFSVTDADGRYHFEGVLPGTHVVQVSRMTLPDGGEFLDCHRDTRSAGSAISRFAIGQGGSLVVADFHAVLPEGAMVENEFSAGGVDAAASADTPAEQAETDWLALGDGPDGWLVPTLDHNPRAPAIRAVIRHRKGQKIALRVDGKDVDPLLFEGTRNAEEGKYAISAWRGIPLRQERTRLSADIINTFGGINETIERDVYFTSVPAKAELVEERSNLVADGRTSPTIAVRILDRNNRPLRAGVSGEFTVNAPYQSAEQLERMQLNQLTGLGVSSARWTIEGNDGVALIELAPTMVSGSLDLGFRFDDGEIMREQVVKTWIEPGDIEWTVIGLAEGSIGARSVADNMERTGRFDSDLGDDARVALYAKGRVLGKYLVTLAYDSAKQEDDQRLLGTLDPNAYYTVFGDASSRQFYAASREKLYLRIETAMFYAIYGDFETGFDRTRLARYNRTATGVKGEARIGEIQVEAFAADISTGFRRDEIQGQGISGPYRLSTRSIVANSEQVTLEVRDRFRSELIVASRKLERFVDYDVDMLSGTITFKQPVLSRDFDLNPQFIVVTYETDGRDGGELNAGVRAEWIDKTDTVRIGASAITDKADDARTTIAALDMRAELDPSTTVHAELAISESGGEMATGWLIEAQHQTGNLDVLAYARSVESEFGVGQQNGAELGRTKVGVDARVKIDEHLSVLGSVWHDDSLDNESQRRAAQIELGYTNEQNDYRLGIAHFNDRVADGSYNTSTVVEGGATRRMLDNKLEVSASTSVALDQAESTDLPTRHRIGARYSLTENVRVVGLYEIADGETVDARTIKGGLEITPWQGAQAVTSIGKQRIDERGERSFAAFGLTQTLPLTPELTIDATLDGNLTLDSDPAIADIVNPQHPLSSGGQLGQQGTLLESFTAATFGAAYRRDRWSVTGRAEYRDGEFADRKGATIGAIRQLGEGSIVGSGLTWTHAEGENGTASEILDAAIALAHRPDQSEFAFLGKLEYRSDQIWNAVEGEAGPAGRTALTIDGDALSRRLIGSFSGNWSPDGVDEDGNLFRRDEYGLFFAARYNFDRIADYDLSGTALLVGTDVRIGIGDRFEIGGRGTLRTSLSDGTASFSAGPHIGFVPVDGALLTIGYNIYGFRDEDFSAARQTDQGLYATARVKLDGDSLSILGLNR